MRLVKVAAAQMGPIQKADDARMPLVARRDQHAGAVSSGKLGIGLGARFGQHARLHHLPLLVEPVERFRDLLGLDGIVAGQEAAAEGGVADTAAGIDARPDQ
ncbi:MAG: hypothetical protein J0H63_02825, partial [Rhizobiales bacterium]|nr:hypothetical protein [Hyphomicrobiales bacterium]